MLTDDDLDARVAAGELPDDLLLARAHLEALDHRIENAFDRDRAEVRLEGFTLPLDEAERTLARKEERRLFAPLRDRVEAALRPFNTVERDAAERLVDELELAEPAEPRLDTLADRLREPAQAALEVLGGELARALDPVDEAGGYADTAARALARAARAASPDLARELTRVRAPTALCGHVVTRAEGPARALWSPTLRGARFARLLEGNATALAAALIGGESDAADVAAAVLGTTLATGLSSGVVRKAVLSEPGAPDRARELRALEVLETFLIATTARDPEEARDIVVDVLGADIDPWCGLAWPGFGALSGPRAATGGRALRNAHAAVLRAALRERFDEAFPIVPGALERVRVFGPALADGASSLYALYEIEPEETPGDALAVGFYETL